MLSAGVRFRPAVCTERLSLTPQGLIHYRLKPPYWDGTTHAVFEPLDFMAPKPRVNLTAITVCLPCVHK